MENLNKRLSVIIPSYKDPLLVKTIASLLENSELGNDLEIISVLDGFWPTNFKLVEDQRVKYIHLGANVGMREAINTGIRASRGKYIMRSDEHCLFGQGYDRILTHQCHPNWAMTARRYFLNPIEWKIIEDMPPVDAERLVIQGGVKFAGQRWDKRSEELKDVPVIESQAMQGSMWLMRRSWFDKIIGEFSSEGYGPHYQDSHQIIFETYRNGGKFMTSKSTYFAHKERSYKRTHQEGSPEHPANRETSWAYSLSVWKDYFEGDFQKVWGK